jgi:MSHA biogenesis protein MshN
MSLVNDMLRDLDARRREVPTNGLRAEKLVPAADKAAKTRSWRRVAILAILLAILAGLLAVYGLTTGQGTGQLQLPPVQTAALPIAANANEQTSAVAGPQTTSVDGAVSPDTGNATALSQLEARLQQLEAQNQALLLAQAQADAEASAQQQQQLADALQQSTTAERQFDQEWADAPALPADAGFESTASDEQESSASSRVARELSFYDRDRQEVQTALQQWASGQQLTALQTLDVFAYENPQAHYSRETLIKLLIQMGETDRAMQAAEIGLAIHPGAASYRKLKARLLLSANTPLEAVSLLSTASPAVNEDTEYHDLLASAYLASRQYEGSAGSYQALLQQDSNEARWWYGLAASLDALGRSAEATSAYEQALRLPALSEALRQASLQRVQAFRQNAPAN